MILHHFRTTTLAAFPELGSPKDAFFRIVEAVAGRVRLQPVNAELDQTKDLRNVEVCPGVPGVTSDPTAGEVVIVAFVGKDRVPYVIGRASEQMPGHTPIEVRHDATSAIWLISKTASAAAKVYVGSAPTVPVALAPGVLAYLAAVEASFLAIDSFLTASVPAYGALVAGRKSAYELAENAASSNLEAK